MSAKARLNRELDRLQPHLPAWGARSLRRIRSRGATMVRIPLAVVLIAAGFVGFLPILGFWMIPLGLALLALDVPFLRGPLARVLAWISARLEAHAARSQTAKPPSRPPVSGRPE
jgi:fatty acid desaturase